MKTHAIAQLNDEKNKLSKCSVYLDVESFETAEYIYNFTVFHACLLFRVRSKIVDVKEFHRYRYGDDKICRCCGTSDETWIHVISGCPDLTSDPCDEGDEFSDDLKVLEKVVLRVEEFLNVRDDDSDEDNANELPS